MLSTLYLMGCACRSKIPKEEEAEEKRKRKRKKDAGVEGSLVPSGGTQQAWVVSRLQSVC
jgi:hypothetical protein